ncbi:hypothetical protein DITRI_Ditri02bG0166800 [Diplodiscus trichospermus]
MMPAGRPSMSKVLKMLETDVEHLEMPPKPFYQLPLETSIEIHDFLYEPLPSVYSSSAFKTPMKSMNLARSKPRFQLCRKPGLSTWDM